jgi:hypothetical protein
VERGGEERSLTELDALVKKLPLLHSLKLGKRLAEELLRDVIHGSRVVRVSVGCLETRFSRWDAKRGKWGRGHSQR